MHSGNVASHHAECTFLVSSQRLQSVPVIRRKQRGILKSLSSPRNPPAREQLTGKAHSGCASPALHEYKHIGIDNRAHHSDETIHANVSPESSTSRLHHAEVAAPCERRPSPLSTGCGKLRCDPRRSDSLIKKQNKTKPV